MAKVVFSHNLHALKEDRHIKADEPVELSEERAKEIVKNIKRDFGVEVKIEVVEPDKVDTQDEDEKQDEVKLEELEAKDLKEIADGRGIEYAKNATQETMLELLQGEE